MFKAHSSCRVKFNKVWKVQEEKKEQKDGDALEEDEPSSRAKGDEFAESFEKQISSRKQKHASNSCTHERGAADQGDTRFFFFNVSLIVLKIVLIKVSFYH